MIHALHGNLGSADDWESLAIDGIVAHDLWADLEADPDLTLEKWGEQFAEKTVRTDPEPILLGYSMGGRLALHAMAAAPNRWKGAILVSTHPGLEGDESRQNRLKADREWSRKAREEDWDGFLAEWNQQVVFGDSGNVSPSQKNLKERREAVARGFVNWSLGTQIFLEDRLKKCEFPVLWITGEKDRKFSIFPEKIEYVFKNFKYVPVVDCGHRVLFEKPECLAGLIREFIESKG